MNKKQVYIIEDNALNRASLENILKVNNYEITGSKATAEDAWVDLQSIEVDVVLIDINLAGEKDGVWLAEKIRVHKDLPLIFLTAYGDDKTMEKIDETKPDGYLMKPYNIPTLLTTIKIAIKNFKRDSTPNNEEKIIYIKDKYTRIKLDVTKIEYIQSDGNYIVIFLSDRKYLVRGKLLDFKKELSSSNFLQVHQRYLINLEKISMIGNNYVQINNEKIPISKRYREFLKDMQSVF